MNLDKLSRLFFWSSLLAVFVLCALILHSQSRQPFHLGLTHPGNKTLVMEAWCDDLKGTSDGLAIECMHKGIVVLRVPHASNFHWIALEAQ